MSTPPSVRPTPPVVSCKQPAGPDIPPAPREDEWIEFIPPLAGVSGAQGVARLSERAVTWIIEAVTVTRKEKALRKIEHDCLDEAEKQGLIRQ